ncbi:uncharacterized protein BP5553_01363 [Venustampulla echinocandica]|uniref:FAD-binding FR-type domain-containing protein n=1 Tax=Venustampulla echinocandica TaxID=2656787 RepID=A0A370U0T1_9HELO|nr:uncharacterized protein BP5553_01363 [Venustampulla echinocandica]RDL41384.1 hypothetical protein BP5553_01363 [Venustampulla echinocandica]
MGAPWLDYPLMLHSSRMDMCKLTAEQCAYRKGHWRYWYQADHIYALNTVYFFVAFITVFAAARLAVRFCPSWLSNNRLWRKAVSAFRFLSYRGFEVKFLRWRSQSIGVILVGVAGAIFFLGMTLGPQPYYWPNTRTLSYGNSPPIATRTGWILGTKASMIASLTGVSHERLIVFHNWVGWAMMFLGLIHTFPFIIFHVWKGDMMLQWRTSVVYWTGVVALIAQAHLTFMSIPMIRDYFIATGVLYTVSFLYRHLRTYCEHGFKHRAQLSMVSEDTLKITISTNMRWKSDQHMFLRFMTLGIHSFTSHPFTICSLPSSKLVSEPSKLVFLVSPRGGTTGRLASLARKQPNISVPVLLDGPYGGLKSKHLHEFDQSLVVAGGGGAGFTLPFILDWLRSRNRTVSGEDTKPKKQMDVVIATRDSHLVKWFAEELNEILTEFPEQANTDGLRINVFLTGPTDASESSTNSLAIEEEKGAISSAKDTPEVTSRIQLNVSTGRPNLQSIVQTTTQDPETTVGISVCGPASMLGEVQNEAAAAQLRILNSKEGSKEVYLYSEMFS